MIYSLTIPYVIPSQNVRERQHWAKRSRDGKKCEVMIRVRSRHIPKATGRRRLKIISYRRRKMPDDANLRGGCKGLVDACVRAGLLLDDRDSLALIEYEQHTLAWTPPELERYAKKGCTTIEVEDL